MFSNAVSTAVGRLYAGAVAETSRVPVPKVDPVARVVAGRAGASAGHGQADENSQRQALADGVRAVFASTLVADADPLAPKMKDPATTAAEEDTELRAKPDEAADPLLEEAILRFIHSVFRGIAEAEGDGDQASSTIERIGQHGAWPRETDSQQHGPNASREHLGRRIAWFAERLARAGALTDPLTTISDREAELGRNFSAVVAVLGGRGEPPGASGRTRGDLVTLMHRFAHAMQGSPPIDEGLPTVGGLLRARA